MIRLTRLQINIRSNEYSEALIKACLEKETDLNKSKFIHAAIERLAIEILGNEEFQNIRLYQVFRNN